MSLDYASGGSGATPEPEANPRQDQATTAPGIDEQPRAGTPAEKGGVGVRPRVMEDPAQAPATLHDE